MFFLLIKSSCLVFCYGPGLGPGHSPGPNPGPSPGPSPGPGPNLVPVFGPGPVPVIFLVPALVPVPVPSYFWSRPWSRSESHHISCPSLGSGSGPGKNYWSRHTVLVSQQVPLSFSSI